MSTRGAYGFRLNGQDKLAYNHSDSYPEYLGRDIADALRAASPIDMASLRERVAAIRMVEQEDVPTDADRAKYPQFSGKDWYGFLREVQGDIALYLNGTLDVMPDYSSFVLYSLSCEWAYIVNLDTGMFEVWRGNQTKQQRGNRYGTKADHGYYPVKMVKEFPLSDIPADWLEQVLNAA